MSIAVRAAPAVRAERVARKAVGADAAVRRLAVEHTSEAAAQALRAILGVLQGRTRE
jgi:hypothetical protein